MIGSAKTLRNGREITFTKTNPVRTFSAIRSELAKRGYVVCDYNIALTGSRYLSVYNDELEIDVRCSNHTTGYKDYGIEVGLDGNGIDSLSIDLSRMDIKIADFRRMLEEIKSVNESGCLKGLVDAYKADGPMVGTYIKESVIPEYLIAPINRFLMDFAKYK